MSSVISEEDLRAFIQLSQDPPFSLPLLDFARELDNVLVTSLPNRMEAIVGVIEQAFGVKIKAHRLFDKLMFMKEKMSDGNCVLKHTKNVNEELSKYSSSTYNLCQYPKSTPFCLSTSLESTFQQCPQYVFSKTSN